MYSIRNIFFVWFDLIFNNFNFPSPACTAVDTDVCIGHGKSIRVQRGRRIQQESLGKEHKSTRVININLSVECKY